MNDSISQKGTRHYFDVVVIGSGIAGLNYILELVKRKPACQIALITKKTLLDSNSRQAQGGIAAVTESNDSITEHLKDTIKAGDGLTNKTEAKKILAYGHQAIDSLSHHGVHFDPHDLAQEGGHSKRRIHHVGDFTGKEIIATLISAVKKLRQVKIFEYHTAINLIVQNPAHLPGSQSEVFGAYVLDEKQDEIHTFLCNLTVLATGGAGKVFRYSSNLEIATGDGIAMAYRAGARLGNLEFYQFHPTLLYHPDQNNFLITEALRGEGAYLLNADTQKRFMKKYAPKQMELATRDIVSRAIFNEIECSEKPYVYLDIRHKDKRFLEKRFPLIFNTLKDIGIDISRSPIPVVPGAHYLCGGILTDSAGKTDLKRLLAIGETAFTGLHGANRLASNSLLEGVAMAHFAARESLTSLDCPAEPFYAITDWDSQSVVDLRRASQINAHWRGLRGEMTSYAGIIRTEEGLADLLKLITSRRDMIEGYYWKHPITRDLIELRNIITVAELIVTAALKRKESRGGHYREDFPHHSKSVKENLFHSNE